MAESLKSKALYKLLLIVIKYIPMVIALCYVLNVVSSLLGVELPMLSNIAGVSILTWIFLYLSAEVFKFCAYHKMFLWYILASDIFNYIDYYIDLPISDFNIYAIHFAIIGVFLFIILFLYVRSHKKSVVKDSS